MSGVVHLRHPGVGTLRRGDRYLTRARCIRCAWAGRLVRVAFAETCPKCPRCGAPTEALRG